MAYDRHDTRDSRNRHPDDRDRYGRDDGRGFFDRDGDEISSWFGDDSSGGRRDDRGQDMTSDRRYGRDYRRDHDRDDDRNREQGHQRGRDDDYAPLAGDYAREGRGPGRDPGRDPRSEYERDQYRRTSYAGSSAPNDPHYHAWKRRQMEELDRDYDDYRREHQEKFESEFAGWREKRQSKRQMLGQIREHMEVVGNDGEHVGTVDCVNGDRIILTRSDPDSGGVHHSLTCSDLERVGDDKVMLDISADKARERWRDESRDRALFEREDQGGAGPHILDRSFSGTYR